MGSAWCSTSFSITPATCSRTTPTGTGRAAVSTRGGTVGPTRCGVRRPDGQPDPAVRDPLPAGAGPDADAIWPAELQRAATFTASGRIDNWDHDPEFLEGDFLSLKDIRLGSGGADDYSPSPALVALCDAYRFWIAFADLDGFRVDTVKHMDAGAARYFSRP